MDANGNAIAVWMNFDSIARRNNLFTNSYSAGAWGTAELLKPSDTNDAFNPTITFDRVGNAIAAWQQFGSAGNSIWTRFYSADNGWREDTVKAPGSSGAVAMNPHVTLDATGNGSNFATVVWQQKFSSNDRFDTGVFANRFDVSANQWGTTTQVVTASPGDAIDLRVASDKQGGAIAVWSQLDGTRRDVLTSRYNATGTWGAPQLLETDNTGNASTPHIATNSLGNAIAVWSQKVGALTRIWANTFITDKL